MNYCIGVDLGTTAVKVLLFDERGNHLCSASEELELLHPTFDKTEQKPESWYEIPCRLIKKVCEGIEKENVSAISVSSQGITILPVDDRYYPIRNGISWLDTRAEAELDYVRSLIGSDRMFAVTGKHMSPLYSLPKILWLKNHEETVYSHSHKILMPMDYFIARSCGVSVTDFTMAGGTMLFDLQTMSWSEEFCRTFGISEDKLPKVVPTATVAGCLNDQTCLLTGLTGKTKIVVGAQDQKIAAYGAGIKPGIATMSLGTAGAIEFPCDRSSGRLPSFGFRIQDKTFFVLEACINTFGAAIKWGRDTVFRGMTYKEMDREAERALPGCGGLMFYPHLSGISTPYLDREPISGWKRLSLSVTRGELIRSIYEGLACEVRNNLEAARSSGADVSCLRVFGGGSRSEIVCKIMADISQTEVQSLDFSEMSAFGAAKAAAAACGFNGFKGSDSYRSYVPSNDANDIYQTYLNGLEYYER